MPRLPQPGSDNGVWGDILNEYLSQIHEANGQLKAGVVGQAQLQTSSVTNTNLVDDTIQEVKLAGSVRTKLNAGGDWSTLTNKPAIVAAGSDAATARGIIGAISATEAAALGSTASLPAADLTPILVETRNTGLAVATPTNLRTGLPTTTMPGGGYASELTIAVTGTAGSRVLNSSEPAKVAELGANSFAAVLNAADGKDDFFVTVLSQDGTTITLRQPLATDFTGSLSSKYDMSIGQHLTKAATRAYIQHALLASGATDGRGPILSGTWDALPPIHNQVLVRNAALIAYGVSNSPTPIVRTELTIQGTHNILHPTDRLEMYPSTAASGVTVGTHEKGHGVIATLYTGRAPATLEFYTAARRSTNSVAAFRIRVVIIGDGIMLYDRIHDGWMTRVLVPVFGIDKLDISVTNDIDTPTPMYIEISNLTLRDAGTAGRVGAGKIVTFGDSWFAYYDGEVTKILAEKAPGISTVNRALGGMTSVWALDWFDQYVLAEKPAECWIHFFTNDLNNNQSGTYVGPDGTTKPLWPTGLSAAQARELWARNLRELINRCQRAGIRPVVFLPGGTSSEAQTTRHTIAADALDRPRVRDWVALPAELTDATSYINTVGKKIGTSVIVGSSPRYASGPAPSDNWS